MVVVGKIRAWITERSRLILGAIAAIALLVVNVDTLANFLRPSMDGEWTFVVTITNSNLPVYIGMTSTYTLDIRDRGSIVSGYAEKIRVNGAPIPIKERQGLEFKDAHVVWNDVKVTYLLKPAIDGAARETTGSFAWKTTRAGILSRQAVRLDGVFSGRAADSSGTVCGYLAGHFDSETRPCSEEPKTLSRR